ncbi:restriction endonuclease [Bradyrhizobium sp. SRS-191]|uniref:restriction endonuclease n=1 Tax=Bradyrhizobium sp. SRS-191 TaxID=2962606 RepID=UPI00211DEABD|nr:restriction endonuclease [Bradyrhizobium sp. SRS-191]
MSHLPEEQNRSLLNAIARAVLKGREMPEITIPRTGSHLRKLFEILQAHPEGLQAGAALKQLAASVNLTPYEAGLYETTGTPRFEKIVRFATIDCVKAGWLVKNRGIWSVTEAGKKAFKDFPDPEAFYRKALQLYREWKASAPTAPQAKSLEELTPAESATVDASITYEKADEQAWSEIEAHLRALPPYDLQDLVAGLLKALGYHIAWVSPPGKDGGIDIIAHTDPLGTQTPRIKVQVKGGSQRIDLQTLNSFLAVVDSGDVGLYVSVGGFTRDAEDAARKQTSRKITLIDDERLVKLWIEAYDKLDQKSRQRLPLSPIYFLTPED